MLTQTWSRSDTITANPLQILEPKSQETGVSLGFACLIHFCPSKVTVVYELKPTDPP